MPLSSGDKHMLLAVNHALNDFKSAESDAKGFATGKRVENRRNREKAAKAVMWTYRDLIQQLIRDANP